MQDLYLLGQCIPESYMSCPGASDHRSRVEGPPPHVQQRGFHMQMSDPGRRHEIIFAAERAVGDGVIIVEFLSGLPGEG